MTIKRSKILISRQPSNFVGRIETFSELSSRWTSSDEVNVGAGGDIDEGGDEVNLDDDGDEVNLDDEVDVDEDGDEVDGHCTSSICNIGRTLISWLGISHQLLHILLKILW